LGEEGKARNEVQDPARIHGGFKGLNSNGSRESRKFFEHTKNSKDPTVLLVKHENSESRIINLENSQTKKMEKFDIHSTFSHESS
jgi:hypothetical protein